MFTAVQPDDVPWATLHRPYGITRMKLLQVSLATNSFTNMIEWEAGVQLPRHLHAGSVHAYTLSGLDSEGNLKATSDFRGVYSALLEQWLGHDAAAVIPGASRLARPTLIR